MPKVKSLLAVFAILFCIAASWFIAVQLRPSHDGFTSDGHITTWRLLAPIALSESGADAVGKEQIRGEANLRPQAGDKFESGLVWKEYRARDFYIDFNEFLGRQTEHCAGYAVCYIHSERDITYANLSIGSDDQARAYLNGKEVIRSVLVRRLDKDQNVARVSLKRGVNVLVFKVINELGFWTGCARFIDWDDGHPMTNLKVSLTGKEN